MSLHKHLVVKTLNIYTEILLPSGLQWDYFWALKLCFFNLRILWGWLLNIKLLRCFS